MQIQLDKFKKLINKATLNNLIDYVQLVVDKDKISSKMINDSRESIVLLNLKNDIITDLKDPIVFNFSEPSLNVIPFLNMFEAEEVEGVVKSNKNNYIQFKSGDTKSNIFFSKEETRKIFQADSPKKDIDYFISLDIDENFLHKFNKIKKIASTFGKIYFHVEDNILYIEATDKTNIFSNSLKFDICDIDYEDCSMMFLYDNLSNIMKVLSPEKDYSLNISYFPTKKLGMMFIKTQDEDERYFLFSKSE